MVAADRAAAPRLAQLKTENAELKRRLAAAIIETDQHRALTLAELEAENEGLRQRLKHYEAENAQRRNSPN